MEAAFNLSGATGTLTLGGSLTVSYATQLKSLLMQGLEQAETVVISFSEVNDIDLSVIQILCSAHRMSVKLNKRLLFGGGVPDQFIEAVTRSGFNRHVGCVLDSQQSCIWASICVPQRVVGEA